MRKKSNKNSQGREFYPIELPSRERGLESTPIVDNVAESKITPMNAESAEIIATEFDENNSEHFNL